MSCTLGYLSCYPLRSIADFTTENLPPNSLTRPPVPRHISSVSSTFSTSDTSFYLEETLLPIRMLLTVCLGSLQLLQWFLQRPFGRNGAKIMTTMRLRRQCSQNTLKTSFSVPTPKYFLTIPIAWIAFTSISSGQVPKLTYSLDQRAPMLLSQSLRLANCETYLPRRYIWTLHPRIASRGMLNLMIEEVVWTRIQMDRRGNTDRNPFFMDISCSA